MGLTLAEMIGGDVVQAPPVPLLTRRITPRRLIRYACLLWLVHASLLLAGDLGLVAGLFVVFMRTQFDAGNPLLGRSVGVAYLGAAATSFAAALLFGLGVLSLDREARAGSGTNTARKPGSRPRAAATALLVWTYGVGGAVGIAAFLGLPLLNVPISFAFIVPFTILWATGAAALAGGFALGKTLLDPTMTERDTRAAHIRLFLYAALNVSGAYMLALGFLGQLLDPVLLIAIVGAGLLLVVGPIAGIAAFRRLLRGLGPHGSTTKPT